MQQISNLMCDKCVLYIYIYLEIIMNTGVYGKATKSIINKSWIEIIPKAYTTIYQQTLFESLKNILHHRCLEVEAFEQTNSKFNLKNQLPWKNSKRNYTWSDKKDKYSLNIKKRSTTRGSACPRYKYVQIQPSGDSQSANTKVWLMNSLTYRINALC